MAFISLDGPAAQGAISLTAAAVQEIKVGASPLEERNVIEIQPIDGNISYYYGDGPNTPNAATVMSDGFLLRKERVKTLEAGPRQPIFVVAAAGTVDVRFAERA